MRDPARGQKVPRGRHPDIDRLRTSRAPAPAPLTKAGEVAAPTQLREVRGIGVAVARQKRVRRARSIQLRGRKRAHSHFVWVGCTTGGCRVGESRSSVGCETLSFSKRRWACLPRGQAAKRKAKCYRTKHNLKLMLYLIAGGLLDALTT